MAVEAESRLEDLDLRVELIGSALRELKSKLRENQEDARADSVDAELGNKLRQEELKELFSMIVEKLVEARSREWELEHSMQLKVCAEDSLRTERRNLERRLVLLL